MSLVYVDRVKQTVSPTGTGAITLLSPINAYIAFQFANLGANSFPYAIVNASQFEVGIGTYLTPTESSTPYGVVNRNLVLSTSNLNTSLVNFNGSPGYIFITNASELSVLVPSQPVQNTLKLLKWINNEYALVDPVLNAPSFGMGINSSVMFYNAITSDYQADPNFQYYPGPTPELYLDGVFQATAKAFKIKHPLKPGKFLMHGCLEGPEYAMYQRGTMAINYTTKLFLPDYFIRLCDGYSVYFSSNSFFPIKAIKETEFIIFKLLFPLFKKITIDYLIVGKRNDVKFELED